AGEWMQNGMFRSSDRGRTWHSATQGLSALGYDVGMAVDPLDARIVYAGTAHGVYKTVDAGRGWSKLRGGPGHATDIEVAPSDPSIVYAANDGFQEPPLFKSTDAGESWAPMSDGLPAGGADATVVDPRDASIAYVGFDRSEE